MSLSDSISTNDDSSSESSSRSGTNDFCNFSAISDIIPRPTSCYDASAISDAAAGDNDDSSNISTISGCNLVDISAISDIEIASISRCLCNLSICSAVDEVTYDDSDQNAVNKEEESDDKALDGEPFAAPTCSMIVLYICTKLCNKMIPNKM